MKNVDVIKFYLKAKSPEGLKLLMINNNITKASYHPYDIMFAGGFWYAWYEASSDNFIKEQVGNLGTK